MIGLDEIDVCMSGVVVVFDCEVGGGVGSETGASGYVVSECEVRGERSW